MSSRFLLPSAFTSCVWVALFIQKRNDHFESWRGQQAYEHRFVLRIVHPSLILT